jgi:hypothetical protein
MLKQSNDQAFTGFRPELPKSQVDERDPPPQGLVDWLSVRAAELFKCLRQSWNCREIERNIRTGTQHHNDWTGLACNQPISASRR